MNKVTATLFWYFCGWAYFVLFLFSLRIALYTPQQSGMSIVLFFFVVATLPIFLSGIILVESFKYSVLRILVVCLQIVAAVAGLQTFAEFQNCGIEITCSREIVSAFISLVLLAILPGSIAMFHLFLTSPELNPKRSKGYWIVGILLSAILVSVFDFVIGKTAT